MTKQVNTLFPIVEQWKSIVGYESYKISSLGRVMNPKGGILKNYKSNHGYLQVSIYDDEKNIKNILIHRLVALHFIRCDGDPSKLQVNHKNKDRFDNTIENLEWVTKSENMKHRYSYEKKVIPLIGQTKTLEVCRLLSKYRKQPNKITIVAKLLNLTFDQVNEVSKKRIYALKTGANLKNCCNCIASV